ncbi:hypothetical protein JCM10296v2_005528 [Rhodotorula toruloides]
MVAQLPLELWTRVMKELQAPLGVTIESRASKQALSCLCLVPHSFRTLAQPLLWRTLRLRGLPDDHSKLDSLRDYANRLSSVHEVAFCRPGYDRDRYDSTAQPALRDMLPSFTNLRIASLVHVSALSLEILMAATTLVNPGRIPRLRHLGLSIPLIAVVTSTHRAEDWLDLHSLHLRPDLNFFPDPEDLVFPSLPLTWRHISHLLSLEFFKIELFKETIEGHMLETAHFRFDSWPVLQPWQPRSAANVDETFKIVVACVEHLAAYTGEPSSGRTVWLPEPIRTVTIACGDPCQTEDEVESDAERMTPAARGPSLQELVDTERDETLGSIANAGIDARWYTFSCLVQDSYLSTRVPEE